MTEQVHEQDCKGWPCMCGKGPPNQPSAPPSVAGYSPEPWRMNPGGWVEDADGVAIFGRNVSNEQKLANRIRIVELSCDSWSRGGLWQ